MKRHAPAAALALALSLTLTACGLPRITAEPAPAPTKDLPDNCLNVTTGAIAKLGTEIAATIPGAEILRTGLVASEDSDMWILAVEFTDPGLDREFVGIWGSLQDLTTDQDPAFVAVDEVAEASAEYLQPTNFDKIGASLPAAIAAEACLA